MERRAREEAMGRRTDDGKDRENCEGGSRRKIRRRSFGGKVDSYLRKNGRQMRNRSWVIEYYHKVGRGVRYMVGK